MSENTSYRHEDIEALLMSKSFHELLDEEKSFVIQHIPSEEEYESMRELLLEMHDLSFDAELKDPPESLETALFHGFTEHTQKVRSYQPRFAPWMGWAIAASVLCAALIFFWPNFKSEDLASTEEAVEASGNQQQPSSDSLSVEEAKPVIEVPSVVLPSEVENLLAQVVNPATPEAPSNADYVYESDESTMAVGASDLSEEKLATVTEAPAEESDMAVTQSGSVGKEDMAMSPAPAAARTTQAETLSTTETMASKKTVAKTEAAAKPNRKKIRNPEVMRLSQSKRLKSLLRSE